MNKVLNLMFQKFEKAPQSLACKDENGSFTWEDFFNFSYCAYKVLKNHGLQQGDCVTIELANCKEFLAIVAACEMMGVAYVPIEILYPEPRIKFIREHSDSKLYIDYTIFKEMVGIYKTYVNKYDQVAIDKSDFYEYDGSEIEAIIYTSGTTGSPKGVVFNADNFYATINRTLMSLDQDVPINNVALILPFCFIGGFQYAIGELIHAAETIIIAPMKLLKSPNALRDFLITNKIQRILLTPSFARTINFEGTVVHSLCLGSENPKDYYNKYVKDIWNGYGNTETGGPVTWYQLGKSKKWASGKTLDGTKIYILDDNLEPAEEGEICVAGCTTAGYYKNEDTTKEVYIENPFSKEDGFKKLVRTGDYGKFLPDGNLAYICRKSNMIKINGQRVEIDEIEQVLKTINGIRDAVVKGFEDFDRSSYLVAYIIEESSVDDNTIRKTLLESLPSYMVPNFFIRMDRFPLSPTGKVSLKDLQPPNIEEIKEDYVAPTNETEAIICSAFEKVFNQEKIGIEDDFIKLGGDSINVINILSELDNTNIGAADILLLKTPKKIAESILNKEKEKGKVALKKQKYYPVTDSAYFMIKTILSIDKSILEQILEYNMTYISQVDNIDSQIVLSAVNKVIDAHPLLKSKLVEIDGDYYYQRRDDWAPEIKIIELDKEPDGQFFADITSPFDIFEDDLFRCTIYKYQKSHYIYMDVQHCLTDRFSHEILLKDLHEAINGNELNPEKTSIYDLLLFNDSYNKQYGASNKKYYDKILQGQPITKIPISDNVDYSLPLYRKIPIKFSAKIVNKICETENITPANYFLSLYFYTIFKTQDINRVNMFVFSQGRNMQYRDSNTIGCLYKDFPVSYEYDSGQSIVDMAKSLKTQVLESSTYNFSYRQYPDYVKQHNLVFNCLGVDKTQDYKFKFFSAPLELYANLKFVFEISTFDEDSFYAFLKYDRTMYNDEDIQKIADYMSEVFSKTN